MALVLGTAIFQTFLRYTYVPIKADVVRVDRLTNERCVLPCSGVSGYDAVTVPLPTADPAVHPEKICHDADVVRLGQKLAPPATRSPTPYFKGGFHEALGKQYWLKHVLPNAVELSDGHVYVFSNSAFANSSGAWQTGQSVQVCATWSRIEGRPYYSVGLADGADPATLAL